MSNEANNKNKEIEMPEATGENNIDFNATATTEGQTLEKITPRKKAEEVKEETEEIEFVARTLVLDATNLLSQLKSSGPEVKIPEAAAKVEAVAVRVTPLKVAPTPTSIKAAPIPEKVNRQESTNPKFFTDPKMKYSSQLDREPLSQIQQIEVNAKIKIAMAESKTFVVAEAAARAALLEFQVNQMLSKIYQKYPDTKNEIIKIQKLLNTHSKIKETDGTKEN